MGSSLLSSFPYQACDFTHVGADLRLERVQTGKLPRVVAVAASVSDLRLSACRIAGRGHGHELFVRTPCAHAVDRHPVERVHCIDAHGSTVIDAS